MKSLVSEAKQLISEVNISEIKKDMREAEERKETLNKEIAGLGKQLDDNSKELEKISGKFEKALDTFNQNTGNIGILRELSRLGDCRDNLENDNKTLLSETEKKKEELKSVEVKLEHDYLYKQIGLVNIQCSLAGVGVNLDDFETSIEAKEAAEKAATKIQGTARAKQARALLNKKRDSSEGFLCLYNLHTEESEKLITTGVYCDETRIAKQQAEKVMAKMSGDFRQRCLNNTTSKNPDKVIGQFAYAIQDAHNEAEFIAKVNQLSKP